MYFNILIFFEHFNTYLKYVISCFVGVTYAEDYNEQTRWGHEANAVHDTGDTGDTGSYAGYTLNAHGATCSRSPPICKTGFGENTARAPPTSYGGEGGQT